MATQAIDYEALAKQAGAISSTKAAQSGQPVDYSALAKSSGAVSSVPAPTAAEPGAAERFGKGVWDTTLGGISNLIQHPLAVTGDVLKKVSRVPELKAIYDAASSGDKDKAGSLAIRFLANSASGGAMTGATDVQDTIGKGDVAGGMGKATGLALSAAAGLKAPEIAEGLGNAGRAVGAGLKAGGPDIAAGAAKVAGGTAAIHFLPEMGGAHYVGLYPIYKGMKQMGSGFSQAYGAMTADPLSNLRNAVMDATAKALPVPRPTGAPLPSDIIASDPITNLRNAVMGSSGKRLAVPQPAEGMNPNTSDLPSEPFPTDSDVIRNAIEQATGKRLPLPRPTKAPAAPVEIPLPDDPFPTDSDVIRNAIQQATGKRLPLPRPRITLDNPD